MNGDDGCSQYRIYTFNVDDECGNAAEEVTVKVTRYYDETAPEITPLDDVNITVCNQDWPAAPTTTWTDNCSGGGTITGVSGPIMNGDDGCSQYRIYTFNVDDECGNAAEEVTVKVTRYYDETAPEITPLDDVNITVCNQDWPAAPTTTWTDNCSGGGTITGVSGPIMNGDDGCSQYRIYTFNVDDECGNAAEEVTVKVTRYYDETAPVLSETPGDITVECDQEIPVAPIVTADDNCDDNVEVTYVEDIMEFTCEEDEFIEKVITRTWSAEDECGNPVEHTQTITVERCCEIGECETSFAKGDDGECFSEYGFSRWGWTNKIIEGNDYTYDVWAGAGQCDTSKGELAGTVSVSYHDDEVTVTYNMNDGFTISDTHLYIGCGPIPANKKGKPTVAPGQYPYSGLEDGVPYTVDVSEFNCDNNGELYIIVHGGNTCQEVCDCEPDPDCEEVCEYVDCETAFALGGNDSDCFIDDGFNRWGWTNQISEGGSYTLDLYAGAALCDTDKGLDVGDIMVSYQGDEVVVTYSVIDGYVLTESHVYVGCDKYPTKRGKPTVAPGQYPSSESHDGVQTYTYTIDVTSLDCDPLWIITHGVICEKVCYEDCEEDCDTLYAMSADNATCFTDAGASNNKWGWTNGPLTEDNYTMELHAGAAHCNASSDTYVGDLYVVYDNGQVEVTYSMADGHSLTETHLYIGCEPLQIGNENNAPGRYPFSGLEDGVPLTVDVSELGCDEIYIIAHGVTCNENHTRAGGITLAEDKPAEEMFLDLKVTPNPIQINGTVSFIPHYDMAQLDITILDTHGRVVKTIESRDLNKGVKYVQNLYMAGLAEGMYYVHLSDGKRGNTERFAIIR